MLIIGTNARIAPNQKWFGNVKVIGQTALQNFQTEMKKTIEDSYQVTYIEMVYENTDFYNFDGIIFLNLLFYMVLKSFLAETEI